jgi:predicted ATPase
MLAYAVLLEDPAPRPFIGIEEPENGLYVRLVETLASQLLEHANRKNRSTQILVTTHSPYFVDALKPEQVWLIRKDKHGHTTARRASDDDQIRTLTEQGIPLGSLWYSNHFDDGSPA